MANKHLFFINWLQVEVTTSLLAIVEEVVHDSKLKGTYVNKYVTEESLIRFYEQHDVEKVNDAGSIIDTFGSKPFNSSSRNDFNIISLLLVFNLR